MLLCKTADSPTCYITANRRLSDNNDKYHLEFKLVDSNDSTTITVDRCCGNGGKTEATTSTCTKFTDDDKKKRSYVYCNSITGGKNEGF